MKRKIKTQKLIFHHGGVHHCESLAGLFVGHWQCCDIIVRNALITRRQTFNFSEMVKIQAISACSFICAACGKAWAGRCGVYRMWRPLAGQLHGGRFAVAAYGRPYPSLALWSLIQWWWTSLQLLTCTGNVAVVTHMYMQICIEIVAVAVFLVPCMGA